MIPKKWDWIELEETVVTRKRRLFLGFDEKTGDIITVHRAYCESDSEDDARKCLARNKNHPPKHYYNKNNFRISCIISSNNQ